MYVVEGDVDHDDYYYYYDDDADADDDDDDEQEGEVEEEDVLMLKLMLMIMVMVKMMIMIMIFEFQASRFWSYTIDTSPVAGEDEAIEVVKAPRFQTTLGDSTATCSKQTCESSLAQRQVTRLHPDDASCLSHHRETLFDSPKL